MEKWLSIDFGERRIGFAIALKETGLAFPRPFLDTKVDDKVIPHILAFCKDERITNILVGMPYRTDGKPGKDIVVKKFIQELAESTILPISTWNEAFSSVTAKEKTSHYSTKKKQKQKGNIDSAAAAVVLQEFLDFNLK
jgi:putative Holliday junction resolvase